MLREAVATHPGQLREQRLRRLGLGLGLRVFGARPLYPKGNQIEDVTAVYAQGGTGGYVGCLISEKDSKSGDKHCIRN